MHRSALGGFCRQRDQLEPFTSACCPALWRSSCSTASALTAQASHSLTSDLYWLAHQYTARHLIPLYLSWTNGLLSAHRRSFIVWNTFIIQGQPVDFSEIRPTYLPETGILKTHHRCTFKDAFGVNKQVLLMLLSLEIWGDRLRDDRSSKAMLRKKVYLGFFIVIVERGHRDMSEQPDQIPCPPGKTSQSSVVGRVGRGLEARRIAPYLGGEHLMRALPQLL